MTESPAWPPIPNPIPRELQGNEQIRTVERFFEAYDRHDLEEIRAVMHEDVEWYIPGRHPLSGTKRGIQEVLDFFRALQKPGFQAEVLILAANEKYVIDAHRGWAEYKGRSLDLYWVLLYQLVDGKIRRAINFPSDLYASDEFFTFFMNS